MSRQRYSEKESKNRILRSLKGNPVPQDTPDTIPGDVLSENEALSDIAELLDDSLPSESLVVPVKGIPYTLNRQGGNEDNWSAAGSSNYLINGVKMQVGVYTKSVGAVTGGFFSFSYPEVFYGNDGNTINPIVLLTNAAGDDDQNYNIQFATAIPSAGDRGTKCWVYWSSTEPEGTIKVSWLAIGGDADVI